MIQSDIFEKENDDRAYLANRVFSYIWKNKENINLDKEVSIVYNLFYNNIKNFYEIEKQVPAIYYYFLISTKGIDLDDRDDWFNNFSTVEELKEYINNYCNNFYLNYILEN